MEWYTSLVVGLLTLGLACGEVVRFQKCYVPASRQSHCTIHEVRLTPCPEAAENRPCKMKLGTNSTLSFDYTPSFSATRVGSLAYKVGTVADIPFEQMDSNGCQYTTCPVEATKRQLYNYSMHVESHFATGTHQAKVKLWDEDDPHKQCCFKLVIQLVN